MPWRSKAAVFRFAARRSLGSGKSLTARVAGSTRAIAFCPPSVTQAAPSRPTITPWGAAPGPSAIRSDLPVLGSSRPSLPADCAVNHTEGREGTMELVWGDRGKMRLRWHEAQAQTVLGQDPPVFVPPITGETRPQRGHGSPAPTPSSARRFSTTSAEGTPVAFGGPI